MVGEVVGMAASVCKKYNASPKAVYNKYFDDMKALMVKGTGKTGLAPIQNYNLGGTLLEEPKK